MQGFGQRILRAREKVGLGANELAALANVDATVLSRVETGKQQDVACSFIVAVAGALALTADELLVGRDPADHGRPLVLSEKGVPASLVAATAREIAERVVPLLPHPRQKEGKPGGTGGKVGRAKGHRRKA